MSLWICQFGDEKEMLAVRAEHRPAHRTFLEKNRDRILFAGPVFYHKNEPPYGAIWLVRGDSAEEVLTWLKADPYYTSGHRSVAIFMWKSAIPEAADEAGE